MNCQQLAREIEMQKRWADELARYPSRQETEPADSQRQLLTRDDKAID